MIGIKAIGAHVPQRTVDNRLRLEEFDIGEDFLVQKSGMLSLTVKDDQQETSDLCCLAFDDLLRKTGTDPSSLDCIVVCTQNPDGFGLPHTSAIVHGKLGLGQRCAAFDISLGCSGYVYGLSIVQSFMKENNLHNGILFTADPYSKVIDRQDKATSLLFGDAATATLLGNEPTWELGKFTFGTNGKDFDAIQVDPETRKLSMNGRKVFTFSSVMVPKDIEEVLKKNEIPLEGVDRFIVHQGSRFIVESISKRLRIPEEKMPFLCADYGNTVSSSIPLILRDSTGCRRVVLSGFGVGLSWASTILTNTGK